MCFTFPVPALIVNNSRSVDHVTIEEGRPLALNCNATGVPEPIITWRRKLTAELVPWTQPSRHQERNTELGVYGGSRPVSTHACPLGSSSTGFDRCILNCPILKWHLHNTAGCIQPRVCQIRLVQPVAQCKETHSRFDDQLNVSFQDSYTLNSCNLPTSKCKM
jgi:hypothetical protein